MLINSLLGMMVHRGHSKRKGHASSLDDYSITVMASKAGSPLGGKTSRQKLADRIVAAEKFRDVNSRNT